MFNAPAHGDHHRDHPDLIAADSLVNCCSTVESVAYPRLVQIATHLSRGESRRSAILSPTIRIVTPVTRPTISAWDG